VTAFIKAASVSGHRSDGLHIKLVFFNRHLRQAYVYTERRRRMHLEMEHIVLSSLCILPSSSGRLYSCNTAGSTLNINTVHTHLNSSDNIYYSL